MKREKKGGREKKGREMDERGICGGFDSVTINFWVWPWKVLFTKVWPWKVLFTKSI